MKTLEQLNAYLEKEKTFAYAIEGHPLRRCQEHVKKVYIELLNLVLDHQETINKAQKRFIQHLVVSIDIESTIFNQTHEIDEIKKDESFIRLLGETFLKYFRGSKLKYNFILDMLLLLMRANDTQKEFMVLICESLGIRNIEIIFLMNLATCILEEDSESYMQLIERVPKSIHIENLNGYAKSFLVGRLIDDENMVSYYGNEKLNLFDRPSFNEVFKNEEMSLERWVFKQDVLIFEYWQIDLTHKNWQFRNNQKVIFKNCEIIGGDYPIGFDSVGEIIIEDCSFSYFNSRVFLVSDVVKLNIRECLFKECVYLYDMYQNSNGCIYFIADKGETVTLLSREISIQNSDFIDCSVWNKDGHYYSDYSLGYSMNVPQKIINCNFKNCLSYMGTPKRLCNGGSVLFNQVEVIECTSMASHPMS